MVTIKTDFIVMKQAFIIRLSEIDSLSKISSSSSRRILTRGFPAKFVIKKYFMSGSGKILDSTALAVRS